MSSTAVASFTRSLAGLVVSTAAEGSATVVVVRGEVDISSLPVLMDVLVTVIADHDGDVVVDLAHTDFIDSASVRGLFRAAQFLVVRGRRLTLRSPSRMTLRILTIHEHLDLVAPALSGEQGSRAGSQ